MINLSILLSHSLQSKFCAGGLILAGTIIVIWSIFCWKLNERE